MVRYNASFSFSENLKVHALKVVVNGSATENYGIDNPPLETNKNYHKNNSLSVPEFGQGLAVGHLVDGEMNTDAAWFYADPRPAAEEIKGRVAFWKGVKVAP